MKWKIDVRADWLGGGVRDCDCKCCEVTQYVATLAHFENTPGAKFKLPSGVLKAMNLSKGALGTSKHHKRSDYSFEREGEENTSSTQALGLFEGFRRETDHWGGFTAGGDVWSKKFTNNYIRDVLFLKKDRNGQFRSGKEFDDFGKPWLFEEGELNPEDYKGRPDRVKTIGSTGIEGGNLAQGACWMSYSDYPECNPPKARGLEYIQGACNTILVVKIGPTRGCTGNTLTNQVELRHAFQRDGSYRCKRSKTTNLKRGTRYALMSGAHDFGDG